MRPDAAHPSAHPAKCAAYPPTAGHTWEGSLVGLQLIRYGFGSDDP